MWDIHKPSCESCLFELLILSLKSHAPDKAGWAKSLDILNKVECKVMFGHPKMPKLLHINKQLVSMDYLGFQCIQLAWCE
mmetsp:Transcript_27642/g.48347  ORF Transcript_27642/g.48347 Transcript_27642/m.48347 type:complete len:80 (+) Transcript_27642:687-926(+)